MRYTIHIFPAVILTFLLSCTSGQKIVQTDAPLPASDVVRTIEEFNNKVNSLQPGDQIVLANGVWKDAELKIEAYGTKDNMIKILPQEKGKVIFEGQSYVKMGGEYIHIEGLVFQNGHTPTSAVIALQKDKETPCNNCRVTEIVIDDYNPQERFDTDYWIEIYGKHNRIDHNYMVAKRNRGVTMAVRMKNERDRENHHRIDHNYFGFHPILGSNGGETLRIGTSHYSLSNSNTLVEDNYFERCNGEHEIISNKSGRNTFRNNTFLECQGTLTMRHGNETLVENNYFFGNRQPNTGGIRVINEKQTVRNNYMHGLTGYRFRGALVIMNGVPNSPLNRYFQVIDSKMDNNIVIDSDYIQFSAGSDEERSAIPMNTTFENNIIYNTEKEQVFTVYDDPSGISFKNNILSPSQDYPNYDNHEMKDGFQKETITWVEEDGIMTSAAHPHIGPNTDMERPSASNTKLSWYPEKDYRIHFGNGRTIQVAPGENTIFEALKDAKDGDVLMLQPGQYHSTRTVYINKAITIKANQANKPILTFDRSPLIQLENGGSLEMENLSISGKEADDYSGQSVVSTSKYSMINNYKLIVKNCDISDLDVNHSFNFLKVYKNTFAESITLENCNFKNISGHVLKLDKETDNIGIYNVENVYITNCTFENIGGNAVDLFRGGRDESTFGPLLWMKDCTLKDVGHDKRNANGSSISIHGVQYAQFNNISLEDSKKINLHLVVGDPVISLDNITLKNSEKIESNSDAYSSNNIQIQ